MRLYCGIDLHSNNCFISIIDETDKVMFEKRMDNNLELIVTALETYRKDLFGRRFLTNTGPNRPFTKPLQRGLLTPNRS